MKQIEILLKNIVSTNAELRINAIDEFAKIKGKKHVKFLIPLLYNSDLLIRNAVALVLREIKSKRAIKPLGVSDPAKLTDWLNNK